VAWAAGAPVLAFMFDMLLSFRWCTCTRPGRAEG
jgi:hypothetical protein